GGLRTAMGKQVEPSALFSIMNADSANAPVQMNGAISSALLRTQVEGQILSQNFGGRMPSQLSADEMAMFNAALQALGTQLFQLYSFFNAIITPFAGANIVPRSDVILANAWITGGADPTQIDFDPANQKVPFPNDQLLTVTSTSVVGGLRVNLPVD